MEAKTALKSPKQAEGKTGANTGSEKSITETPHVDTDKITLPNQTLDTSTKCAVEIKRLHARLNLVSPNDFIAPPTREASDAFVGQVSSTQTYLSYCRDQLQKIEKPEDKLALSRHLHILESAFLSRLTGVTEEQGIKNAAAFSKQIAPIHEQAEQLANTLGAKSGHRNQEELIACLNKGDSISKLSESDIIEKINSGKAFEIATHIDRCKNLTEKTAMALIAAGEGWSVAKNISLFEKEKFQLLANELVRHHQGHNLLDNAPSFLGVDFRSIAKSLLDNNQSMVLAGNIDFLSSQGVSKLDAAKSVLEHGNARAVAANLDRFPEVDQEMLAQTLLDANQPWPLAKYARKFDKIALEKIATMLAGNGYGLEAAQWIPENTSSRAFQQAALNTGSNADQLYRMCGKECLKHPDVVTRLIGAGEKNFLTTHFALLTENQQKSFVDSLIERKECDFLFANRDKLAPFSDVDIVARTIEADPAMLFNLNIAAPRLVREVGHKLIDKGKGDILARDMQLFKDVDHDKLVETLIQEKKGWAIADVLRSATETSLGYDAHDIAEMLIKNGQAVYVLDILDKVPELPRDRLASALITQGKGEYVAAGLSKFPGLNESDCVDSLIAASAGSSVMRNLDNFKTLSADEVFKRLVKANQVEAVFAGIYGLTESQLNNFANILESQKNLTDSQQLTAERLRTLGRLSEEQREVKLLDWKYDDEAAIQLLKHPELRTQMVAASLLEKAKEAEPLLENMRKLSQEEQKKLITKPEIIALQRLVDLVPLFSKSEQQTLAEGLLSIKGGGYFVGPSLANITGLSSKTVASRLIDNGDGWTIAMEPESYPEMTRSEIIDKLIKTDQGWSVAMFLENFPDSDKKEIASKIIQTSHGWSVGVFIEKFGEINQQNVANEVIKAGHAWSVISNPSGFASVNWQKTKEAIIKGPDGDKWLQAINNPDFIEAFPHLK